MPKEIPKVIHCIWVGGGQIAPVPGVKGMDSPKGLKGLDGITSWLDKTDYTVWIWWDDAHLFNGETRKEMGKGKKEDPASARSVFDQSVQEPDNELRKTVAPGLDIHNLRFLSRNMSADEKLKKALELINKTQTALQPLRDLEKASEGRVKLCNLRKHEFLPGQMNWMNRDLYDLELRDRGMFFAAASDILRYEILYNFGGVYMDVDLQLTGPLGELSVAQDSALVAIEDDKDIEGQDPFDKSKDWEGRDSIVVKAHGARCFYLMNNIVASHAGSQFIQSLRETIRLAYDIVLLKNGKAKGELDSKGVLAVYRQKMITGSVLDMTGPNLIRDNMYLRSLNTEWAALPAGNLARLVPEVAVLNRIDAKQQRKAKQAEFGAHARTAAIWRDDDPKHQDFWNWVAQYGSFPMEHVNWKTLAADASDCRIAGMQVLKDKVEVKEDH